MPEKLLDVATKTLKATERGAERLMKKAWSVVDAASEKRRPSEYLGERARRSIQGKVKDA